jgi:hypothetical protein
MKERKKKKCLAEEVYHEAVNIIDALHATLARPHPRVPHGHQRRWRPCMNLYMQSVSLWSIYEKCFKRIKMKKKTLGLHKKVPLQKMDVVRPRPQTRQILLMGQKARTHAGRMLPILVHPHAQLVQFAMHDSRSSCQSRHTYKREV